MNTQELLEVIERDTGIDVVSHRLLLDGWDNLVLEVNDEFIFRFTRRPEILEQHIKELELLPLLNEHLTLRVPDSIHHQTETQPYYIAYRKIPGKPITRSFDIEVFTKTLTQFLMELQSIDTSGLKKTPRYTITTWKQEYLELHNRITLDIYPKLSSDLRAMITNEFNRFQETLLEFNPVLCHRDLGLEHIMESGGLITGVIDWGDSCIGDPAFDLTGLLMGFGEDAARCISDNLDFPPDYLERARFYSKVSPFFECIYGIDIDDEAHIKTGLEKINKAFDQ